jgi:hypothetical protein
MDKEELICFLKENLSVNVECDYDGCDSPEITVSISLGTHLICESSDYLLKVD